MSVFRVGVGVCVCVCLFVYLFVMRDKCVFRGVRESGHVHIPVCMYVFARSFMRTRVVVELCICFSTPVCVCARACVCMYYFK